MKTKTLLGIIAGGVLAIATMLYFMLKERKSTYGTITETPTEDNDDDFEDEFEEWRGRRVFKKEG